MGKFGFGKGFDELMGELKNGMVVVVKEVTGSDFVDTLKEKSKQVQVKMEGIVKNLTTEELEATETDGSFDLVVALPGLGKGNINISIDEKEKKLNMTLKDNGLEKTTKKHWSVSKNNIFWDFSRFGGILDLDKVTSKYDDGILTVTIPKKHHVSESVDGKRSVDVD